MINNMLKDLFYLTEQIDEKEKMTKNNFSPVMLINHFKIKKKLFLQENY